MKHEFRAAMLRATAAVRSGNLMEATRMIQATLSGTPETPKEGAPPRIAKTVEDAEVTASFPPRGFAARFARAPKCAPCGNSPADQTMVKRSYTGAEGSRAYRLSVPATPHRGVLMMLHGCKQNPEDFAVGTRMNDVAGRAGLIVIWPEQPRTANMMSCWNWFEPSHQSGEKGEPAILAAIARQVGTEFGFDGSSTYVAGLSAGGAMAAILAEAHPATFAAVGIHSGLPAGSAHDTASAFAAMSGKGGGRPAIKAGGPRVIIFHGDSDKTVHVNNLSRLCGTIGRGTEQAGSSGGRNYIMRRYEDATGEAVAEAWTISGAGHAWSGGNASGSFADASGPDASAEMVRFFTTR